MTSFFCGRVVGRTEETCSERNEHAPAACTHPAGLNLLLLVAFRLPWSYRDGGQLLRTSQQLAGNTRLRVSRARQVQRSSGVETQTSKAMTIASGGVSHHRDHAQVIGQKMGQIYVRAGAGARPLLKH